MTVGHGVRELRDLDEVVRALGHASRRHVLVVLLARGESLEEVKERFPHFEPVSV